MCLLAATHAVRSRGLPSPDPRECSRRTRAQPAVDSTGAAPETAMTQPSPGPHTERRIADRVGQISGGDAVVTPTLARDLDRLFAAHRSRVYALCMRIVKDSAKAEELVQDTLLAAYEKLPGYAGEARFSTWIHGIARNLCFNAVRKKGELLTTDGVLEQEDPALGALAQLRAQEREALLREASAALTPVEQEAIYLRYVEGIPQDQITAILDLPGTGARGLLQRCRRHLQRDLRVRLTALGHGPSFFHEG